jgi:acyl-CoA thioester hydrolase
MQKEHLLPLRIYHEDVDIYGMVYHANHLKFMERGRSEWLIERGVDQQKLLSPGISFAIHSVQIDYLRPIKFQDQIEVVTTVINAGKVSMEFLQSLRMQDQKEIVFCTGRTKIACLDKNFRPHILPSSIFSEKN